MSVTLIFNVARCCFCSSSDVVMSVALSVVVVVASVCAVVCCLFYVCVVVTVTVAETSTTVWSSVLGEYERLRGFVFGARGHPHKLIPPRNVTILLSVFLR